MARIGDTFIEKFTELSTNAGRGDLSSEPVIRLMLDSFGFSLNKLEEYILTSKRENNLATAIYKESLYKLLRNKNYTIPFTTPAKGYIKVSYDGDLVDIPSSSKTYHFSVFIPNNTIFVSEELELLVYSEAENNLGYPSGSNIHIENSSVNRIDYFPARQLSKSTLTHSTGDIVEDFYQIEIPIQYTEKISSLTLKEVGGDEWSLKQEFRNSAYNEKNYTIIFKSQKYYILFGDNQVAKKPDVNTDFEISIFETSFGSKVISGSEITLKDDSNNNGIVFLENGNKDIDSVDFDYKKLKFTVHEDIDGSYREPLEVSKQKAIYSSIYLNDPSRLNEYEFYIRQTLNVTFLRFWGEEIEEARQGAANIDYINKIFWTFYDDTIKQSEIEEMLEARKLHLTFQHVDREDSDFFIEIDYKILSAITNDEFEEEINNLIEVIWGRSVKDSPLEIKENDLISRITELDYFKNKKGYYFALTLKKRSAAGVETAVDIIDNSNNAVNSYCYYNASRSVFNRL